MFKKSVLNPNLANYPKGFQGYWTIHNKRYDMSLYIDKHPGGRRMILQGQGRNCTELFESYHSLSTMNMPALLERFYVEDTPKGAPDYDDSYDWDPKSPGGKFWETIKERVKAEFRKPGKSYKASPTQLALLISLSIATFATLPFFFKGYWFSIVLLPILYYLSGCTGMHDGGHFGISKHEWVNNVAAFYGSAVSSPMWWALRHNVGHHEHTNVAGKDPDLVPLTDSMECPALRKHTVIYMLPTLATFFISYLTEIVFRIFNPRNEFILLGSFSPKEKLFHYFSRILFFSLFIVYPFRTFPLYKAIAFAAVPYMIHGGVFYTLTQISHFNDQCFLEHEKIGLKSNKEPALEPLDKHWAVHQVRHTMDWGIPAPYPVGLSIGLCYQTVHHLFPQVYHMNLATIQPIVEETCKEFGVKYNWVPTMDELIEMYGKLLERNGVRSVAVTWVRNQGPIIYFVKWLGQKLGQTHPKGWKY